MRELEEAEALVASHRRTPSGLLRVSIPVTFSRFFLAPVLPSFCHKYPEVDLEFTFSRGNVDLVAEGLDAAILIGPPPDSTHIARRLGSFYRGLFASHDYLACHPKPVLPADLVAHDMISMNRSARGCNLRLTTVRGRSEEVNVEPRITIADPVLAESLASSGIGIAVLPLFLTTENQQLTRILPEWSPPPVDVFALYPSRHSMTPKLAVFLSELESKLMLPTELPRKA